MEILCFFAGIVFFYTHSLYSLLLVFVVLFFKARWPIILWFIIACGWAFIHHCFVQDQGMPDATIIPNATIIGHIASIPVVNHDKTRVSIYY